MRSSRLPVETPSTALARSVARRARHWIGVPAFVALAFALSATARADGDSVPGPDGTPVTRESYPTELVLRPLVPPPGMLLVGADLDVQLASSTQPSPGAKIAYAFGRGFLVGVEGTFLGDVHQNPEVELFGNYLFGPNVAANFWADYAFDDGSNDGESFVGAGFGVPLKLKILGVPLAVGALGDLFNVHVSHWPARTVNVEAQVPLPIIVNEQLLAANGVMTRIELPAWIEYSPLHLLSFEAGEEARLQTSNDIWPTYDATVQPNKTYVGEIQLYVEAIVTLKSVDLGVVANQWFVFATPSEESTDVEVFALARF